MDPTLAAILTELFRLSAENERLKQQLRDLDRERPAAVTKEAK